MKKMLCGAMLLLSFVSFSCKDKDNNSSSSNSSQPDQNYLRDRALLDQLQKDVFVYAWDFSHPVSGLVYERYPSTDKTLTSGGSGFAVAAVVTAVDRGFISRKEGLNHLLKMTDFLLNKAAKFKGAFPHWWNEDGSVYPFSTKDNGGDIVETSFLIEGLIIAREYFNGDGDEAVLRDRINQLWHGVNWNWYTDGNNYLLWHWSPQYGFEMNHKITGFNECFVTYLLAMASPTYPISRAAYDGWTSTSGYQPKSYNGFTIQASEFYGGPLFFVHYSFIGMDPRKMADDYVTKGYYIRNVNQTMVNRAYCLETAPVEYKYAPNYWGLTASYNKDGYSAHAPGNDNGTVAPTAALSSLPYTPYYSMQVLWNLYSNYRSEMWSKAGPADAMNLYQNWFSTGRYLAIDQLPIISMVENYRSGKLWQLFMQAPEIQKAMTAAGIHYPTYQTGFYLAVPAMKKTANGYETDAFDMMRHPDSGLYELPYFMESAGNVSFIFKNATGTIVYTMQEVAVQGENMLTFSLSDNIQKGAYTIQMKTENQAIELPIRLH